jgi:pimeloyl-ACP methyl ester carboxylesterase
MNYKRSKYFKISKKRKIKYFFSNRNSEITVVFFHGFMSDMTGAKPSAIQKFCGKQKLDFLKFEYSGHGQSTGKFIDGNISIWTNDAKKLIRSKIKKNKKIIFIGSSMGSWIALNLFEFFKKRLVGFIGIASAPEFLDRLMWRKFSKKIKKIIMSKNIYKLEHGGFIYPLTKQLILDGKKNKIFNKKINLSVPIILFHGTKDKVVPIIFSKKILRIIKKSKAKLIKINKGDHSLSRKSDLSKICKELRVIVKEHKYN